jgi:HEAT repeat protein
MRKAENLSAFITALDDSNEAIRWWAAQGCSMLREKAAPAADALLNHLADSSGAVRVAAAEALARMGKAHQALPTLEAVLTDPSNSSFALQAANVIAHLGEAARPSLPMLKRTLQDFEAAAKAPGADRYGPRYPKDLLKLTIEALEGVSKPLVYPSPAR